MPGAGCSAATTTLNPPALKRLLAGGAQLRAFPQDVMEACYKAANDVYAELSKDQSDVQEDVRQPRAVPQRLVSLDSGRRNGLRQLHGAHAHAELKRCSIAASYPSPNGGGMTREAAAAHAGMSERCRGWPPGGVQALADQPSRQASSRAADGALDRRTDRADHHERRDDAGADDLRPRHRDAVVSLDRLAVPIEPAVAVDRQPAEIGHVDRMDGCGPAAWARLGLPARRARPTWAAADRRCCRPESLTCESGRRRIAVVSVGGAESVVAQARVDEGREETHRAPCFPARARKSKRAQRRGRAPRGGQLADEIDSLGRDVGPLRRRFVGRAALLECAGLAAPVARRDVAVGGHAERRRPRSPEPR